MNLKLTNEVRSSVNLLHKAPVSTVKEERRRNGRYVAVLVGICLFLLAMYHAWVRRIPVVASLVVPALIMFVYVGWVLLTAARDKRRGSRLSIRILYQRKTRKFHEKCIDYMVWIHWLRHRSRESLRIYDRFVVDNKLQTHNLLDAEAALNAKNQENEENESHTLEISRSNMEISESSKESSKINSPDDWSEISSVFQKGATKTEEKSVCFIKPIILVNDKLPEDLDQKWTNLVQTIITSEKQKEYPRRKFKRKFCRSRRPAALKRSYSIG